MGDRICRSSGAGTHGVALFYKYVAATRLGRLSQSREPGQASIVRRNWEAGCRMRQLLLCNCQLAARTVVAVEGVRRIDLDQIISHLFIRADVQPDGA